MAQIRGVNFMGAVVKLAQFGNAPLVDIKPRDGNPGSRKGSRNGQPDIAKPDDRDFTPVCHELVSPNLRGRGPRDRSRTAPCGTTPRARRCPDMIRKLKSGEYRLYSRKTDPRTGKRRNLGTFDTREAAQKHEREVQYFKRH